MDHVVSTRLELVELRKLQTAAAERGISVAEYVREIVLRALEGSRARVPEESNEQE